MEKEIHLESAGIKYWVEPHPLEQNNCFEEKIFQCKIKETCYMVPQKITLEINLYKNVNSYGLLGIDYKPIVGADTLEVKIAYVKQNHILYNSDLVKYDMYMYCGLPEEYVTNVFNKIQQYVQNNTFMGGELIIPFAANSEVRSSPRFFEILIEILMILLAKNISIDEKTNDSYDEIIKEIFLKSPFFKNDK